jgi:plasmid stability protein
MKATIELDDALYHRLKVAAAQRGRKVKDLVADGVRFVLREQAPAPVESPTTKKPAWFGSLRAYAKNAGGLHDLASMRKSVARGRGAARPK